MQAQFTKEKFNTDIKRGTVLEDLVRQKFEARGFFVTHIEGKFKYWDFAVSRGNLTAKVEVKNDLRSTETGNFCLEKQSLDNTIASLMVIGTPQEAYLIPTDEVRKLFHEATDIRDVGDQRGNYSAIIPKWKLIEKAKRFI
jgi:hypothetical protein